MVFHDWSVSLVPNALSDVFTTHWCRSFVMFVTYGMASAFGVFQDYYAVRGYFGPILCTMLIIASVRIIC